MWNVHLDPYLEKIYNITELYKISSQCIVLFSLFITLNYCFNINYIYRIKFCTSFVHFLTLVAPARADRRHWKSKCRSPVIDMAFNVLIKVSARHCIHKAATEFATGRVHETQVCLPPWSARRFSRELLALSGFLLLITSRAFIRSTSSYCCGANTVSKYIPFSGELCFLPSGWVNPNGNGRRLRATALIPNVTIPHARTIRVTDRLCTYLRWWRFVNSFVIKLKIILHLFDYFFLFRC